MSPISDSESVASITQAPSNILVVEDDSEIRSLARTFLEHEGFHVYTSGDAERAAQIFHRAPHIDLLITDYYLPRRSGMDLAIGLKSLRLTLPILFISGPFLDALPLDHLRSHDCDFLA